MSPVQPQGAQQPALGSSSIPPPQMMPQGPQGMPQQMHGPPQNGPPMHPQMMQGPPMMQGPHGPQMSQMLPQQQQPPGQENLNALQKAIDSMEEKGLVEDPRYSQLLAIRANSKSTCLSSPQLDQLRSQIMAYRQLARNLPISKNLVSATRGQKTESQTPPQCSTPPASTTPSVQTPQQPPIAGKKRYSNNLEY